MNPTLEQLARYIAQELERGIPESTIRAALIQHGWTTDWVDAAVRIAKQQPTPYRGQSMAQATALPQPQASPRQAWVQPQASPPAQPPETNDLPDEPIRNRTRAFIILAVILSIFIAIGVGAYMIVNGLNKAEIARQRRDATRREHLSLLLNELSDYYVVNSSYPTRDQLNNKEFLEQNGFEAKVTQDPLWTAAETCTKDGRPQFTESPTLHCYAYESTTSEESVCDNKATPCARMKLTMLLEKQKQPNVVIFDQNSEIDP
jgi:hypothetical protein